MTIDTLRGSVSEQRDEKAERAVKAFRQLQPTLTAYARVLTGKKNVRVDMAARDNGSTDGTRIYFRPPIALGDMTPHNRFLCDKRDERHKMLCPACALREEVMVTIYHEIAHICFDSFEVTSDAAKKQAIEFAIRESRGKYAERIRERIANAPFSVTSSYISLASLINEYLPFLLNCLEDARVNRELFKARKGLKRMFFTDTRAIMENGFENREANGLLTTRRWSEAPLNSQAMIGCFCKASGYDYTGWFHPSVESALNDEVLTGIINKMDSITTAGAVFGLSFEVLARLRELGFCGTPQDPDPEESDEEDQEADASSEDESTDESAGSSSNGEGSEDEKSESSPSGSEGDPTAGSGDEGEDSGTSGGPGGEPSSDPADRGSDSEDEDGADVDGTSDEDWSPDSDSVPEESSGESTGSDRTSDDSEDDISGESGAEEDVTDSAEAEGTGETSEEDQVDDEGEDRSGDSEPGGGPDDGEIHRDAGDSEDSDAGASGEPGSGDEPESSSREAIPHGHEGDEGGSGLDDSGPRKPTASREDEEGGSSLEEIDTGADDGYGGTMLEGDDTPPMGTPDDLDPIIKKWGQHDEKPKSVEASADEEAVRTAIIQGIYFTTRSKEVAGVNEYYFDRDGGRAKAWQSGIGQTVSIEIDEKVLQPSLLHIRRVFTDNQVGEFSHNRKSGRVNRRVLGTRAWNDDERLFSKKTQPGKKDYEVIIGMDISGSTIGVNLRLEKQAIYAQAELLHRAGIPFSIYAHTGEYDRGFGSSLNLQIYHIKDPKEPWTDKTKERLYRVRSASANLDGHAMEYLRKRADESQALEKIILYYSDGKMPCENHDEELEILRREIAVCRHKNYTLLGVGIRTDSPMRHGLDTVQVEHDSDLMKVVKHLGKRLSEGR